MWATVFNFRPGQQMVAIAAIVALALVNIRGVRLVPVRTVANGFEGWLSRFHCVVAFGFQVAVVHFVPLVAQRPGQSRSSSAGGWRGGSFFAFAGWCGRRKVAGEFEIHLGRCRALLSTGCGVTLIYVLTSAAFVTW